MIGKESIAKISVPMKSKRGLAGRLILGEKLSEESYSDDDAALLTTLANQLAVAVENALLHKEILERERELARADKLAALGTVAAGMAHEIKNPLSVIKGMTQVLQENLKDENFTEKFSQIIPRQLDRINNIVENLLRFGKKHELKISDLNINQVLKETLLLVKEQCKKKNIKIIEEYEELPAIAGDPEQLSQAFLNLALNAIQAIAENGELKLKTKKLKNDEIFIEISDTGIGIPEESLGKIFDPFFTTKEKGAGLGLAVTYRIIKEHRGEIRVKSEVGRGTTFMITIQSIL